MEFGWYGIMIGTIGRIVDLKAAQFNGTDEYAYVDNPSFKANTAGAFIIWYRPAVVLSANGVAGIIGYGATTAATTQRWIFCQRYTGALTIAAPYRSQPIATVDCRTTNGGTINGAYASHIFSAGTLEFLVVQSNGSAWSIYRNGVDVTGGAWTGTNTGDWLGDVAGANHRLTFGSLYVGGSAELYGSQKQNEIGYVAGRVLTSGEITSLYNSGTPLGYRHHKAIVGTDLVSHWSMGDRGDSGTTIVDRFGQNHLSLMNMDASNYVTP